MRMKEIVGKNRAIRHDDTKFSVGDLRDKNNFRPVLDVSKVLDTLSLRLEFIPKKAKYSKFNINESLNIHEFEYAGLKSRLYPVNNEVKEGSRFEYELEFADLATFQAEADYDTKTKNYIITYSLESNDLDFYRQPNMQRQLLLHPQPGWAYADLLHIYDKNGSVVAWTTEDVPDSYAAYFKPQYRHNKFKAGKMGMIDNPFLQTATGTRINLQHEIINQSWKIYIPQDIINSVLFPVVIGPTIGYTVAGSSNLNVKNNLLGHLITMPENGVANSMWITRSDGTVKGVLYSYSAGIGTLVDETAEQSGYVPGYFIEKTFNSGPVNLVAGTQYILMMWGTGAPFAYARYDSGANAGKGASVTYGAAPASITTWDDADRLYSDYILYEAQTPPSGQVFKSPGYNNHGGLY